MSIESKVFEKLFNAEKVELASQKYEFVSSVELVLKRAADGYEQAKKAKIAINELKAQSKNVADLVDNFNNGPYFDVVITGKETLKAMSDLGLQNSSEYKNILQASDKLAQFRNELKNGNDYRIK
jgi:hypothetical protein